LAELRGRIAAFEASETERLSGARLPDGQEQASKEIQEHMVRSQELAVLEKLARGVGHELRNPLGAIKNAVYFLNMALEEPEQEVKDALEILEKNMAKSEKIISGLLDFARSKPPTLCRVNINDVVQEALFHASIPDLPAAPNAVQAGNIEVVSRLDETLPTILADPDQLGRVFENIIINAIQSMPEGGKLVVKTEVTRPDWMAVCFADTGVGIPKENLKKLFEPLFTTKAKGIGLGLALAKILIEGHGGTIEVKSTEGRGSTFTVRLPSGLTIED